MITKVIIGSGIGGTLDYLMNEDKKFKVIASKWVCDYDKNSAKNDFRFCANENPNLKKWVMHVPMSFHVDDKSIFDLNPELKVQIIDRYIELMTKKGFHLSNTQFIAVEHNDTNHPHWHCVFNRVDAEGKTVKDKFIGFHSKLVSEQIELEFGLTIARDHEREISLANSYKPKEIFRAEIYTLLKEAKKKHGYLSMQLIKQELDKSGIELRIVKDGDEKIMGSYYVKKLGNGKQISIKTSAISEEFSFRNLIIQHQLFSIRKKINDNNVKRGNSDLIVTQLNEEIDRYAYDASKMMDNLSTIMTLGLFVTVTKKINKKTFTNPFAKAEELAKKRAALKEEILRQLREALKLSKSIDELKELMKKKSIQMIVLQRENIVLLEKAGISFLSTDLEKSVDKYFIDDKIKENAIGNSAVLKKRYFIDNSDNDFENTEEKKIRLKL